ncbi:MAG TPA: hypothetical protein VFW29_08085 [Solirubrobacteraceae bacterium]|nr:hypothetical protein [Solirubrobacteraceae bacterium]
MRTTKRPRHYLAPHWLVLLRPVLRYSHTRQAYVLRGVGAAKGPVLRADRRRGSHAFEGAERRHTRIA